MGFGVTGMGDCEHVEWGKDGIEIVGQREEIVELGVGASSKSIS